MDKKTALVTLLKNSFWITGPAKKEILLKLDTMTDDQIDVIGKFLVKEREIMIRDEEKILADSAKLLQSIAQ